MAENQYTGNLEGYLYHRLSYTRRPLLPLFHFDMERPYNKILLLNNMGCTIVFNPFPNKPWFLCVCSTSLLKTLWEKEKLLVTSNFSFSHSVFYLFEELSDIFNKIEIVICRLFQFGRV